jgi:hypothetical protein
MIVPSPLYSPDEYQYSREEVERVFQKVASYLDQRGLSYYALGRHDVDMKTCVAKEGDVWAVYDSERGRRIRPAFFLSLYDAVNFVIWRLTRCPTVDLSDP